MVQANPGKDGDSSSECPSESYENMEVGSDSDYYFGTLPEFEEAQLQRMRDMYAVAAEKARREDERLERRAQQMLQQQMQREQQ